MTQAGEEWLHLHAPAKLNLWLDVLARRTDGYHEVDTGLVALEWGDRLAARLGARAGVLLELDGPAADADVPTDRGNLAVRAAELALEALGSNVGVELRLTKCVPSRAGLGGGSSDAAAALAACELLLQRELDEERAHELLGSLGADCVFFRAAASTGFARCTGRGDVIEVLASAAPDWHVVVLVPDVGAVTADVYGALDAPLRSPSPATTVRTSALHLEESALRGMLSNGLERAALLAVPGLAPWRDLLDDLGLAHFRLSGSGSSFFGLFRATQEARSCLVALENATRERGLTPRALVVTRLARRAAGPVSPG